MKKYRVRYIERKYSRVDVIAESKEEAKKMIQGIHTNNNYNPEIILWDGPDFDYLTEIDENDKDIEGSDWD